MFGKIQVAVTGTIAKIGILLGKMKLSNLLGYSYH